ncbi:MAG: ATP-binding protein, partial [Campylobacterota bacterium]|nr:ATP-binding protein [Campylobacterota bacterium]
VLKSKDIKSKYIFINTKHNNKSLYINIKDNGGGIDENIIDKIFEPYFTTYHQSQGKGLGLYTVKIMLERYLNSIISVDNENFIYNENRYKGAIFKINLNIDN